MINKIASLKMLSKAHEFVSESSEKLRKIKTKYILSNLDT